MKISRPLSLTVVGALAAGMLPVLLAVPAQADTLTQSGFEGFTLGSPNGQQGWKVTRAAFDYAIVDPSAAWPSGTFGHRALRMSNSVVAGSFGDQLFSAQTADEAGETSAENGGLSGGTRQQRFTASFMFGSAAPSTYQDGLVMGVSPDRGDGARMGLVRLYDMADGLKVTVLALDPATTDFTEVTVASGLDRTTSHRVSMVEDFVDGEENDTFTVSVDDATPVSGSSWEEYFRDGEGNPTRTVDSLLFRSSIAAPVPSAVAGKGFLVDNVVLNTGPATATTDSTVLWNQNALNANQFFSHYDPDLAGADSASAKFVAGPGTPPLGLGSYQLSTGPITGPNNGKWYVGKTITSGPLTSLTALSYASRTSTSNASNLQPYVNVTYATSGGAYGNLVYDPVTPGNGVQANGVWKTQNAFAPTAIWRSTKTVGTINAGTTATWADFMSAMPGATFHPLFGGVFLVAGSSNINAGWTNFVGDVDALKIGINNVNTTYDFDNWEQCPSTTDSATKTITLTGDCSTPSTLTLSDGWTLDGAGHTITAYDTPTGADFTGAVLINGPQADPNVSPWVSIKNLHLVGTLNDGCTGSLFGIKLNASGGSITHSTISDIRYGPGSGCQGGNSIDITNLGGASRLPVTVDDVQVTGFQKTGIRANGNVALTLTNSSVADAQLDMITASNSLQISRGARAYVFNNTIGGNDWDGDSTYSATGVLLFDAGAVTFTRNTVSGTDTDFGLYAYDDGAFASGNVAITCNVFQRDSAADSTPTPGQARDLWNTGVATDGSLAGALTLAANTVTGFATAFDGVTNEVDGPCSSGPVGDLAATGAATSVTATWTAPTGNETAPVTSYDVTLLPGGATQTVTGTTATFNGLSPAKEYSVTVTPVNPAGHGIPASTSATTGPGAATITQTSTTDTSASAQWSVPGGAYSSFHVVLSDAGGPVATHDTAGDERSWTFTGLDPDSLYTITVTPFIGATAGASDSEDVTTQPDSAPAVLPGAVTGLDVEGATASVTAAWDATPDATSYLVTLLPGGTVHAVSSPTTTFSGLTPAKEYTVTVVPVNAAGSGTSASGSATTGPGAATITSTSTTDTSATAQWSVLGTAYTSFHVVISDDGVPVATKNTNGDERMWTFTGLDPDTDYAITVTPRIGGLSGASDSADVTTNPDSHAPHDAPGPVTGLALTGTSSSLTATWTAAPGATDYEATLLPGGAVQAVNGTTATFPIVPGKEYTITVAPHNANGWGPSRSASLDTALPTVPGGLSVSGGTVSAALTWTPSTAASPVTAYTVTATPTSGSPVTLGVPAGGLTFPVTVTGLTAHTTYTFSVTATNAFGTSAAATKTLKGTNVKTTFSPAKVTYGKKSTVTGKVTDATSGAAVAGQTIYLYGRVKGTTTYVKLGAKATSAANGTFTFTIAPHVSRRYYVTSLGADRMGANSASKPVPVKATVTMSMNRTTVHALTKVTFTGSARPKVGGVISLQRLEGSTWVTKKTVTPTSAGKYLVTWTPASKVDYRWRVVVSGPSFTKAASASQVLTVI